MSQWVKIPKDLSLIHITHMLEKDTDFCKVSFEHACSLMYMLRTHIPTISLSFSLSIKLYESFIDLIKLVIEQ